MMFVLSHFGDVPDSGWTFAFDLPDLKAQRALIIKQLTMLCNPVSPLSKYTLVLVLVNLHSYFLG